MNRQFRPSRRNVITGSGALFVSFSLVSPASEAAAPAAAGTKPLALTEVDSFLAIDAKGTCTIYSGKVDLGTGVATALRQIAADELDLPLGRVDLVQGDTLLTPDQGKTWGSITIQIGGMQIRQACAAAKHALFDEAARQLAINKEDLKAADGAISGGGKRLTYPELIGGKRFSIKLDPKEPVSTKDPKDFKVVGQSVPRLDIPAKVTGTFTTCRIFACPACCTGAWCVHPPWGRRCKASMRARLPTFGRPRLFARTISWPWWLRMSGQRSRQHASSRRLGRNGKACKGPPTLVDVRGALDDAGNVSAWESEFFIPQATAGSWLIPLVGAKLAGLPQKPDLAPGNIFQNSAIPYKFPNIKTVCQRLETTPFRPSWIRTPGRMQNTYANECFVDELAAAAGADPIDFRLKYIDAADKRGIEVLDRLVKLCKWKKRPSPQRVLSGDVVKGRGASYVKYELYRTYVGAVAEVEVDRATGVISIPRFYVAHDCGQIINPDGLKNQIEGSVIQTISRTLTEELKFDRSAVTSLDWQSYPILAFPQVPEVVIDLIDRPTMPPWGAGEPAAAVVPSAIANAVFDAAGVRLRSIPYTPEKVKAAIRAT